MKKVIKKKRVRILRYALLFLLFQSILMFIIFVTITNNNASNTTSNIFPILNNGGGGRIITTTTIHNNNLRYNNNNNRRKSSSRIISTHTNIKTSTKTIYDENTNKKKMKLVDGKEYLCCRGCSKDGGSSSVVDTCPSDAFSWREVTYYNPLSTHSRYLCGTEIPPLQSIKMKNCKEPGRLFPFKMTSEDNDETNTKVLPPSPPIVTSFLTISDTNTNSGYPVQCPVVENLNISCREIEPMSNVASTRHVRNTPWRIIFSMEGSGIYPQLLYNTKSWQKDRYYSTTSFESEIPLPYYSAAEYRINASPVLFQDVIKGASFVARNCNSKSHREALVQMLIDESELLYTNKEDLRIDSLSSCLKNRNPSEVMSGINGIPNKNKLMKKYMFHLSFENQLTEDYITEKLWGALESGVIPVYFGSTNVQLHAPSYKNTSSIIHINDFGYDNHKTKEEKKLAVQNLLKYLYQVSHNETLYNLHQEWRKHHPSTQFQNKLGFTSVHSTCRTCHWAYAKMYGLGWNHEQQTITSNLKLGPNAKRACFNNNNSKNNNRFPTLIHPMVEPTTSNNDDDTAIAVIFRDNDETTKQQKQQSLKYPPISSPDNDPKTTTNSCKRVDDTNRVSITPLPTISFSNDNNDDEDNYNELRRVVWEQDGILDITYQLSTSSSDDDDTMIQTILLRWQLSQQLQGLDDNAQWIEVTPNYHYRIQNNQSRITFLLSSSSDNSMHLINDTHPYITLQLNTTTTSSQMSWWRLRIIMEDLDDPVRHADSDQLENYYGNIMQQDFDKPIEAYY